MKKSLLLVLSSACILSASQSAVEIFKKCGTCHGDKGQKHSLNITQPIAGMNKNDLIEILYDYKNKTRNKYGLGTMMQGQAKNLSDDDIKALANLISEFPQPQTDEAESKTDEPKSNIESNLLSGKEIFTKCAICHGDNGEKNSLGVSKVIAGMKKEDIVDILKEYQARTRDSYGYGAMMGGQATKLSDKEMDQVAKYISTLTAPVKATVAKKSLTKEEAEKNTFIKEWFDKSKDPNANLKDANIAYEIYKKSKGN
ncbi:MAG: c-type cytochrome [Sulfurimonadaceae bacterium]|jgi:cytochrome c553|nr:c-type cytochrome [Sulfurimonadaceae bacterium]